MENKKEMRIYLNLRFATTEDTRKARTLLSRRHMFLIPDFTELGDDIREMEMIRDVQTTDEEVKDKVSAMLKDALDCLSGLRIEKAKYAVREKGHDCRGYYDLPIEKEGKDEEDGKQVAIWSAVLTKTNNGHKEEYGWDLGRKDCDELLDWLMRNVKDSIYRHVAYVEVKVTGTTEDRDAMMRGYWPDCARVSGVLSGQARTFDDIRWLHTSSPLPEEQCRQFVEDWLLKKKDYEDANPGCRTFPWVAAVEIVDDNDRNVAKPI